MVALSLSSSEMEANPNYVGAYVVFFRIHKGVKSSIKVT